MNHIIDYAHGLAKAHLKGQSLAIDCTVGKGQDTLFLAKHASKVIGFDIQESALEITRKTIHESGLTNIELILDSHEHVLSYLEGSFDLAMFNLGYLPGGDKSITTQATSTLLAIDALLSRMTCNSVIIIVVYVGHEAGLEESIALEDYLKDLTPSMYFVTEHRDINHKKAPYVLSIKKR